MPADNKRQTISKLLESTIGDARLRILIVGAGIAGSTLAALLHQRGQPVAIIERASANDQAGGYMLGLMPLGGRVLNGLGFADSYRHLGVDMRTYDLYGHRGNLIRSYPLDPIIRRFGAWRGIERGDLVSLLRSVTGPIEYNTTVTALDPSPPHVVATFNDGSAGEFDLVVAADGIHSTVRSLVLAPEEVDEYDTGWGGFVAWSTLDRQKSDTYAELWSSGWGIGLYPVKDRLGVFLAGQHDILTNEDAHRYATELATRLPAGPFAKAIANLEDASGFYWRMADIRSKVWSRDGTLLLGDAAAAFLPTAGVGASVAMDSAAALADELL